MADETHVSLRTVECLPRYVTPPIQQDLRDLQLATDGEGYPIGVGRPFRLLIHSIPAGSI